MSLSAATLLTGLVLAALGGLLLWNAPVVGATARALPRSRRAALVFFGCGAAWFLWNVIHLSEADFGQYRWIIFAVFAAVALLSFRMAPDFLAVRGLCILVLLAVQPLLAAAYMRYDEPLRLFMVSVVYLAILTAIYLGGVPYRLRDFSGWLFAREMRARTLGAALGAYGVLLAAVVAFAY